MRDKSTAQNLPVSLRRREDQGMAEIGVTFEGAFLPLNAVKLGHLDKLVQQAKDKAEAESATPTE